jgi:formate dehydrogenase iron-sulfur subunit
MCVDRVSVGLLPACVKACPTGAMQFGDRSAIRKTAEERLEEVRKIYRRANLVVPEAVRVIFLVKDYPEKYHEYAASDPSRGITRKMALKQITHPVASLEDWIG